jgi:hypothetical protein
MGRLHEVNMSGAVEDQASTPTGRVDRRDRSSPALRLSWTDDADGDAACRAGRSYDHGRRSSEAGALQPVALLGPRVGRVDQRETTLGSQLLHLVKMLSDVRGFLG